MNRLIARETHGMTENFTNIYQKKDLYPEYKKNFYKSSRRQTDNPKGKWAKDLSRHFKRILPMANKHMKRSQEATGKCTLKSQ